MLDVTNELMYGDLKQIRAEVAQINSKLAEHGEQLKSVRHMLIALQSDDLRHEAYMAAVRSDVDLIKRRLDLSDS